jgi:RHS repeat-associated protein
MNGQTLVNAFVKLPGGARAVYSSSGLAYYRHSDHLGSSRLATTPSRTKQYDVAYAPYGEDYNGSGTQDLGFTDQNQDTVKNGWATNLYDFTLREYRTAHGRWTSPDPAGLGAVDPASPQSWNRYAYVSNNPLDMVDLLGDDGCYDGNGMEIHTDPRLCGAAGGFYLTDGLYLDSNGIVQQQGTATGYSQTGGDIYSSTPTTVGSFSNLFGYLFGNTINPNSLQGQQLLNTQVIAGAIYPPGMNGAMQAAKQAARGIPKTSSPPNPIPVNEPPPNALKLEGEEALQKVAEGLVIFLERISGSIDIIFVGPIRLPGPPPPQEI